LAQLGQQVQVGEGQLPALVGEPTCLRIPIPPGALRGVLNADAIGLEKWLLDRAYGKLADRVIAEEFRYAMHGVAALTSHINSLTLKRDDSIILLLLLKVGVSSYTVFAVSVLLYGK
jgi:hypothetical protein